MEHKKSGNSEAQIGKGDPCIPENTDQDHKHGYDQVEDQRKVFLPGHIRSAGVQNIKMDEGHRGGEPGKRSEKDASVIIGSPVNIKEMMKTQVQQGINDRSSVKGTAESPVEKDEAAVSEPGTDIACVKNTHDIAQSKEEGIGGKKNDSGRWSVSAVGIPGNTVADHQDEAERKKKGLIKPAFFGPGRICIYNGGKQIYGGNEAENPNPDLGGCYNAYNHCFYSLEL